ncbi:cupin domain-containing protein [Streptomyces sp. NPDC060209]|uniref:cupin domain-containing protein n=1 Tax=Streptomyces sp. NPDC060209 TaxID=3347073 RepID=UPI00365C6989
MAAFSFGDRARTLLLEGLPGVIHVPAGTARAETLQWALAQIDRELQREQMGAALVAEHLEVVMLVHVLRLHLARDPDAVSGWLRVTGTSPRDYRDTFRAPRVRESRLGAEG